MIDFQFLRHLMTQCGIDPAGRLIKNQLIYVSLMNIKCLSEVSKGYQYRRSEDGKEMDHILSVYLGPITFSDVS